MVKGKHKASDDYSTLRVQIRLLMLLQAVENAGIVPIRLVRFHTFAFLSNVLAPVWEVPVFDGKIFKRKAGPFYPTLQRDLDLLVGMGLVVISDLRHTLNKQGRWQLDGSYRLNHGFADKVIGIIETFEADALLLQFLQELAFAFSTLSDTEMERASGEDATYADSLVDFGNVLDFAEWQDRNCSANAAEYLRALTPGGIHPTSGEMIRFYVMHLKSRLTGGDHK
jgi:hypothetical protein